MSMTKEQLTTELQNIEKAIQNSEMLRQRATANKEVYEEQIKQTDEELKALGTTSEKAQEELASIDAQISKNLKKINEMIPFDLLRKYNKA
jgi:chromosome segregation ATPase